VAPDRDTYIEAHSSSDLEEGEVDTLARAHTILFLFDRSGSMADNWDGMDKWDAAAEVMEETVASYQSYVTAGALFFPMEYNCEVLPVTSDAQIDFMAGNDFMAEWERRTGDFLPTGSTPMNAAFIQADRAIAKACADGLMARPLRVVLISDGAPNCDFDAQALIDYPARWLAHGVPTYVVGLPGSSAAADLLSDIAEAGGTVQQAPDTDADSDGQLDSDYDSDGDGQVDSDVVVDVDTDGIMDADSREDLGDSLIAVIE
jgi:hypothetical protein